MHRMIRWLALGAAVFLLAACSHEDKNAPLAYVPADTPYLVANLKPLTDDARAGLMPASVSSAQRTAQVSRMHRAADALAENHKPHLADLVRAFADSMQGKTYAQLEADMGIDPHGMFAIYGLGLSPVLRGQLNDAAKFDAYVAKLEKAYGKPFTKSALDDADYQHITLGKSGLQLLVATHDKQYVIALLSASANEKQLRLALGLTQPEHSVQETGRLARLAETEGYGPYVLSYVDITKLPALLAGTNDPLLHALVGMLDDDDAAKLATQLPASCRGDLARIAARMPMISAGYTHLDVGKQTQQVDFQLAADIVKAFQGTGTHLPGLGTDSNAPLDIALALPVPAFRNFWLAQAEAVAAKPFTCPALTPLNERFARMQKMLPKTAVPPFGDLRGFRLVLDHIDLSTMDNLGKKHQPPTLSGRLLVASHNPAGLLNLAKAMLPGVAKLDVKNDGTPVALPPQLTDKAGLPAWVAMSDTALAIGVGPDEKGKLAPMLAAAPGKAGTLAHAHVTGKLYLAWLDTISDNLSRAQAKQAAGHKPSPETAQTATDLQADLAATRAKFSHLKDVASRARLTERGVRITSDVRWK